MITKSLGGNTKQKHAVRNISNTRPAAARKVNVMLHVLWHNLKKESSSTSDKLGIWIYGVVDMANPKCPDESTFKNQGNMKKKMTG